MKTNDIEKFITDGLDAGMDDSAIIDELLERCTAEEISAAGYANFIKNYMEDEE